jgi:hypothetical protein
VTEIVWQDPPDEAVAASRSHQGARTETRASLQEKADALRASPGQWGLIESFPVTPNRAQAARSMAHNIRRGRYVAFRPAWSFDAVSSTEGDRVNIYAKWLGDAEK